jgi:hypothetical protein
MIRRSSLAGLALVLGSFALVRCGGSPPAQPAPVPTVAPTPPPAPAPTPPQPLSMIPPCPWPESNPGPSAECTAPKSVLANDVNAAIDRVLTERPDLFNLNDVDGGPKILDYDRYMTAVIAAVNLGGLCGKIDPEGEISIKQTNAFSEHFIVASKAGWNPPAGNWVRRKYVGACKPAMF